MSEPTVPDPAAAPDPAPAPAALPDPAAAPGPAARVAAAVLAHRGVTRLDGGPFGTVASHLPGRRRILGVRLGAGAEPTEIAVVARLGVPLPRLADEVAAAVRTVLGPVPVEVTFSDVVPGPAAAPEPPTAARRGPDRLA